MCMSTECTKLGGPSYDLAIILGKPLLLLLTRDFSRRVSRGMVLAACPTLDVLMIHILANERATVEMLLRMPSSLSRILVILKAALFLI